MISNDPKFNLGQLNAYKLMFAIKLLMEKRINNFWSAGFSDLPAINARIEIPHIGSQYIDLFDKSMYWDPMCGISILADFRPMGYKLSCCDSLWSR